ncbi:MAG: hypothetical protein U0271_37285 [Polyangiaceae bacterium]
MNGACGDDAGTGATGAGATGAGGSGAGGTGAGGTGAGGTGGDGAGGDGTGAGGSPDMQACDHEPTPVGDPLKCDLGQLHVAGDVAGNVDESFVRGFGANWGSTFSEIGTFGLLYFPAVATQPGETTSLRGLMRFPDESTSADEWYCLGNGTELTQAPDAFDFTGSLDSLSHLGNCDDATPVTGELDICFTGIAEGCTTSNVVSNVPAASFEIDLAGGYVTSNPNSDKSEAFWLFAGPTFDQTGMDVAGAIRFDATGIDLSEPNTMKTATLSRGFVVVPPGAEDEGAVYCVGDGSTIDYQVLNDGVVDLQKGSFKNLKRLGACPAAEACVAGNLQVCAR